MPEPPAYVLKVSGPRIAAVQEGALSRRRKPLCLNPRAVKPIMAPPLPVLPTLVLKRLSPKAASAKGRMMHDISLRSEGDSSPLTQQRTCGKKPPGGSLSRHLGLDETSSEALTPDGHTATPASPCRHPEAHRGPPTAKAALGMRLLCQASRNGGHGRADSPARTLDGPQGLGEMSMNGRPVPAIALDTSSSSSSGLTTLARTLRGGQGCSDS